MKNIKDIRLDFYLSNISLRDLCYCQKRIQNILVIVFLFLGLYSHALGTKLDTLRTSRPKVGLVLSGGGAKGFAHVGALKVLRQAGIEVDYISGTSMGAIVGGLYAIGYSPEYIEEIVRAHDWVELLVDKIDRRDLSIDEKTYNEQQFISFPVTKNSVSLPFGIKYGQSVSLMLSKLVSPVHQIHQFKDFQTPFLCVSTSISDGKSRLLESGDLAEAMRASMAIPTIFTPEKLDGILMVDGGLVNNFPAKELASKGCEIIIGVDVQESKAIKIEDLNTITSILDRSASFYRKALNDTAMKYIDYYIQPNMDGYGVGSFADYDSIMKKGEEAALSKTDEFKELANYLARFDNYKVMKKDLLPLNSFVLDSIKVVGNVNIPSENIKSMLPFAHGEIVYLEDIEKTVKQIYGSLFFNTVRYHLLPSSLGSILVVTVEEASFGSIGLGIHYDTDYKAGILISSKFRNILLKNTLLEIKVGLSENPHASIKFYQNNGLLPSFGISSRWTSFSFVDYRNGKDKIGEYRFSNFVSDFYVQSQGKKTVAFGGGVQIEMSSLYNNFGIDFGIDNPAITQSYFNLFAFLKIDRFDKSFFPHTGGKFHVRSVFVTTLLKGGNLNPGGKITVLSGVYDKAIPISSKWTLRPRVNAGFTFGTGLYYSQMFFLGGQGNNYLPGMISFSGLKVSQLDGNQILTARMQLQYNVYKKHYIMTTVDAGNIGFSRPDLFEFDNGVIGYGITYGYDSFLGPIEVSLMGSNFNSVSGFINLGFWF